MLAPIGAGAFGREDYNELGCAIWSNGDSAVGTPNDGVAQIRDSTTYVNPPDQLSIKKCTVRAAKDQRPYLRLTNFWRFSAAKPVNSVEVTNAKLTFDGLWIGTRRIPRSIILESSASNSNFELVTMRYCTLDPGGVDANGVRLPPVSLVIDCIVDELIVENFILADIHLQGKNSGVNRLLIRDSIVHAQTKNIIPINLPTTQLKIERCTVLAFDLSACAVNVERIDASDTLVVGIIKVTNTQNGCFRFSASALGSQLPLQYRSHNITGLPGLFAS
jgi:hypothetical protein